MKLGGASAEMPAGGIRRPPGRLRQEGACAAQRLSPYQRDRSFLKEDLSCFGRTSFQPR
jgi:hypothetical protein